MALKYASVVNGVFVPLADTQTHALCGSEELRPVLRGGARVQSDTQARHGRLLYYQ